MNHEPGAVGPAKGREPGWRALLSLDYIGPTTTISLGVALYAFNEFFVATALPSAVDELGGAALISWAFTFFLVFAIVGGLAAADLKARLGARTALALSALVFLVGSAITVIAPNMPVLIAGRAIQGIGEGVVAAICYALIPVLFPSPLVQKIFGLEAFIWAIAAFGGPVLAGFLTEFFSWRVAFGFNLVVGCIFLLLVFLVVPKGGRGEGVAGPPLLRLGLAGGAILIVSVAAAAAHPMVAGPVCGLALLLLVGVVSLDRRNANPVLPGSAFRWKDPVGIGLWMILLMPMAQAAGGVFMVYGFQFLWGYGATIAGGLAATLAVAWSVTAILVAMVSTEIGRLRAIAVSSVLLAAGAALAAIGVATYQFALMIAAQVTMGAGMGLNWGPLCQLLMSRTSDAERDRTSAMLPTLQTAGYALGAAVFGLVANLAGFGDTADLDGARAGMTAAYASATLVALVAAVFGVRTVRGAASIS
ncbi:MFS transporter [Oricola sp.]|uniref:MFS transporter n=1 Tax=Oricola sp. TaxID=1979950 RepID=UPI00351975D6